MQVLKYPSVSESSTESEFEYRLEQLSSLAKGLVTDALVEFNEYLRLEPYGPFASQTRTLIDKISRTQKAQTH